MRKQPLAKAIASTFSLLSIGAWATDLHVTNCSDSGAGSLRAMITSAAPSGDRVVFDTGSMNCSAITLTSGAVQINAEELTLQGPTQSIITIDANHASRVIYDTNTSGYLDTTRKLTINNLTIQNGHFSAAFAAGAATAGCIFASGDLTLNSSTVTGCTVENTIGSAFGGSAFAHTFHAYNSRITNNSVSAASTGTDLVEAAGGGVGAFGIAEVVIASSVISGNTATASGPNPVSQGGGIFLDVLDGATVSITATSVEGNVADRGGGAYLYCYQFDNANFSIDRSTFASNNAVVGGGVMLLAANATLSVTNSTISENSASNLVGGIVNGAGTSTFINDTIAFNTAASKTFTSTDNITYNIAAGLSGTGTMTNTIVAQNTVAAAEWDIDNASSPIVGSNNLIMLAVPGTTLPPDTLSVDPMLAALGTSGGPTSTHALMTGSPAIDAGCTSSLKTDQRGPGFPRQHGAAVDIGAYEFGDPSSGDVIFVGEFDGVSCSM